MAYYSLNSPHEVQNLHKLLIIPPLLLILLFCFGYTLIEPKMDHVTASRQKTPTSQPSQSTDSDTNVSNQSGMTPAGNTGTHTQSPVSATQQSSPATSNTGMSGQAPAASANSTPKPTLPNSNQTLAPVTGPIRNAVSHTPVVPQLIDKATNSLPGL